MGDGREATGRRAHEGNGTADRGVRAEESGGVWCKLGGNAQGQVGGREPGGGGMSAESMLADAESLLREGRAEDALPVAMRALDELQQDSSTESPPTATAITTLPFLTLIAEIHLELGSPAPARAYFLDAVALDPSGSLPAPLSDPAAKFLYLAQLSEAGGHDSLSWFGRGAAILRREIGNIDASDERAGFEKRRKLAGALCGMAEVYMTDLSWEERAEKECERLIEEAVRVAPGCAEPLQTVASVRISQGRMAEARTALRDSLAVWEGEGQEAKVPEFATRVSLARLLMEVGMEREAVGVVERLVGEDDGCVEAWYLGGWALYLLGTGTDHAVNGNSREEEDQEEEEEEEEDLSTQSLLASREWLRQSLRLYELVEYEDERLREHAMELVEEVDGLIGSEGEDEMDGRGEEWKGFEDDEDEDEVEDEGEEMDEG